MKKLTDPNTILADKIFKELVKANLIAEDNKEFLEKFSNGKLKESDWQANLLDRMHRKSKPSKK